MQGIWVVLGLVLFPSVVFAQAELTIKADNVRAPIGRVACEIKGSNLFVVVGDPQMKETPTLTLLLRNYGTVAENTQNLAKSLRGPQTPTLTFKITDETQGAASLIDNGNHWRVYNSKGITADSSCEVQVTPAGGELRITLGCSKLSLLSENLTLEEKQKRMVDVVSLSEPVRCVPQRRN